jgi:hypothetical protein
VGVAINVVLFNRWKLEAQREGWRTIDTSADLCICPLLRIVYERTFMKLLQGYMIAEP